MVVAGTGIVIFVGYKIYKAFSNAAANKDTNKASNDAAAQANELKSQGMSLSFPQTNYDSVCNTIANKLDGCTLSSTEWSVLGDVFSVVKNQLDWYNLIKTFGTRQISTCGSFGYSSNPYDLSQLLKIKLDTSVVAALENINGTTYNGLQNAVKVLATELKKIGVDF